MSVRSSPVETVVAVPSHSPSPSPSLRGARSLSSVLRAADVGCYSSGRIGGAAYPCGAIVSYGDFHLSDTYIITSKGLSQLGAQAADRLESVLPGTAKRTMQPVRDSMNTIDGGPTYRNMFQYKIYQHGTPFSAEAEIASFGAKPVDVESADALGEAFKPVMATLAKAYPAGYKIAAFRITSSYY